MPSSNWTIPQKGRILREERRRNSFANAQTQSFIKTLKSELKSEKV